MRQKIPVLDSVEKRRESGVRRKLPSLPDVVAVRHLCITYCKVGVSAKLRSFD